MFLLQLVHQIPEAGITYQRVPPGSTSTEEPEQSCSDHEPTPTQQTLSRDEVWHQRLSLFTVVWLHYIMTMLPIFLFQVAVDNLMLNPMSEIITAIRENTEQLADKIKSVKKGSLCTYTQRKSHILTLNPGLVKKNTFIDPVWLADSTETLILLNLCNQMSEYADI